MESSYENPTERAEYDALTEQERADYDDAGQHGCTHAECMDTVAHFAAQRTALEGS